MPPVADAPRDAAALYALIEGAQRHRIAVLFHDHARIIALEGELLTLARAPGIDDSVAREIADALGAATGQRWRVAFGDGEGAPSLGEASAAASRDSDAAIRELPVVKAALAAFPAARILPPEEESRKAS